MTEQVLGEVLMFLVGIACFVGFSYVIYDSVVPLIMSLI